MAGPPRVDWIRSVRAGVHNGASNVEHIAERPAGHGWWEDRRMLRKKSHKFAIQTKGLDDEQAAQLMYLICAATESFDVEYRSECNVPVRTLKALYPRFVWE
jgi:hypothetical protein